MLVRCRNIGVEIITGWSVFNWILYDLYVNPPIHFNMRSCYLVTMIVKPFE